MMVDKNHASENIQEKRYNYINSYFIVYTLLTDKLNSFLNKIYCRCEVRQAQLILFSKFVVNFPNLNAIYTDVHKMKS